MIIHHANINVIYAQTELKRVSKNSNYATLYRVVQKVRHCQVINELFYIVLQRAIKKFCRSVW